jgi:hypothetical protein
MNEMLKRILPKLQMQELIVFVLILVVAGIAAMIGLSVQNNFADNLATCNTGFNYNSADDACVNGTNASQPTQNPINLEYNASIDARQGIANITDQFPNIGLVVAAVVIIGLLVAGFAFAFRGGGGGF